MNFICVCLHSLDMRDFHSHIRTTPFLDDLRGRSVFIPMGRGQGHHQADSLNAEMTGVWTARCCDSELTSKGYIAPRNFALPPTVLEQMQNKGFEIFSCMKNSFAVNGGMRMAWLRNEPGRLGQFNQPEHLQVKSDAATKIMRRFSWLGSNTARAAKGGKPFGYKDYIDKQWMVKKWCRAIKKCKKNFYAHYIINTTHRPWGNAEKLCRLLGEPFTRDPLRIVQLARRAPLENPGGFAALRREGLADADRIVKTIFEETSRIKDVVYLVYSDHGVILPRFH